MRVDVKRHAKKWLVPHGGNDYKPHFFRAKTVGSIAVLCLAIFGLALGYASVIGRSDYLAAVLPSVLVDLTNDDRAIYSLQPLTINPLLEAAAREKANDMARYSYFAHVSPTGISPWYWISKAGYRFVYAGENLAINFSESNDVNRAWMDSPTHRANILNGNFSEIGIATAEGFYEGQPTIFAVQMFGRPSVSAQSRPSSPSPAAVPVAEPVVVPLEETPTFIAVQSNEPAVAPASVTPLPTQTLGDTEYGTLPQRLLTNPSTILNYAYAFLMALVLLAILLSLTIEFKRHHAKHVMSGALLVIFVIGLSYAYSHIVTASLLVK